MSDLGKGVVVYFKTVAERKKLDSIRGGRDGLCVIAGLYVAAEGDPEALRPLLDGLVQERSAKELRDAEDEARGAAARVESLRARMAGTPRLSEDTGETP